MIQVKQGKWWLSAIGLYVVLVISGCTTAQPQSIKVTCFEAKQNNYTTVTDVQMKRFLDESVNDADLDQCWKPAMKNALQQNRPVGKRHLVKAIDLFNQRCDEEMFHCAVSQYLSSLTPSEYRAEDHQLLAAYTRYSINQATSSTDTHLKKVKLLCATLDRELYNKFFE